jgi:hypothetical protein
MVRLNCLLAWLPWPSVTFIVKVNVPAVVGVPDSWLLLSAGASVDISARPGGSCPEATDQVWGAWPPLRKKFWAYAVPTVLGARADPLA